MIFLLCPTKPIISLKSFSFKNKLESSLTTLLHPTPTDKISSFLYVSPISFPKAKEAEPNSQSS